MLGYEPDTHVTTRHNVVRVVTGKVEYGLQLAYAYSSAKSIYRFSVIPHVQVNWQQNRQELDS